MSRARTLGAALSFVAVSTWRPLAVFAGVALIVHGLDLWSRPAAICGAGCSLLAFAVLSRQKRRIR